MDLGLASRRAWVTQPQDPVGAACARMLAAEGAIVLREAGDLGAVDIVVALAGSSPKTLLEITSAEELGAAWEAVVDTVDVYGKVLPTMAARGWGRLVWVGTAASRSLDADDDEVGAVVTLAMRGAGKVIAAEAGPSNVTANTVLYGGAATPDDIAATVAFLCSRGAGYISGATITVDGGSGSAVF